MKTHIITIALLCCLTALQAQIPTDAIAHYAMDGEASDASPFGNHGTLIGGVTTAPDRFGYACGALKFDGVTGYITVPSSPSLKQPTTAFTVAVWVKMEQNPSSPTRKWLTVCCKSDQQAETPTSPQWRVQSMQDDARGYNTVSINTDFTEPAQENLLLSTWFMYVLRYDGKSVNAYIDGKQVFTFAYNKPFSPNDMPLEIGRDVPGGMEFFCGTMDDLYIFDRALSASEINAIYQDQSSNNRNANVAITCPADIVRSAPAGKCSIPVMYQDATATADCGNATVRRIAGPASETEFSVGETTVTFEATAANGQTSTCSFVVKVLENGNATIQCPPSRTLRNDVGTCGAVVTYADPTASSSCSAPQLSRVSGPASGAFFPMGETTVTYRAGKSIKLPGGGSSPKGSECSFKITVQDQEPPTITCPADVHVQAPAGSNSARANFPDPQYADNCPGVTMTRTQGGNMNSNSNFPIGTTTLGFQARDAAGNTATCSFKVIVDQANELGLHCPSDRVVPADLGDCATKVTFPDATLTGNMPNAKVTQFEGQLSGSAFSVGTETITFHASSPSGERADCSFRITVEDREKPTIKCPADVRIAAREGSPTALVNFPEPQYSDNCPGVKMQRGPGSDLQSGAEFPVGTTTLSYVARDAAGNSATCSFDVEVTAQATRLGIRCPSDKVVPADAGTCEAIVNFAAATATGDAPDATINQVSGPWSGSAFPLGMQTIKYAATDGLGRQAECSFRITVRDEELPTITCPGDVHIQVETGKNSIVSNYPEPQYADNCPGVVVTGTRSAGTNTEGTRSPVSIGASGSFPLGNTILTYKAQDASGNTATCSFTVTVTPGDPQLPARIDGDTVVYRKDEIPVGSRNIRIYYYDNHDQDGDTISLNYDGRWLVDHEKILGRKKTLEHNRFIDLDVAPGKVHYLVSKAWNEGKKPTNTLTLEIIDGVNPPRIFDLTSNVGKSSAIKIYYKK